MSWYATIAVMLSPMALAACATSASMETKTPVATYTSAKAREVVTECLLDRLTTDNRTGTVQRHADHNVITFGGMLGVVLSFTVRDADDGSTVEMRRLSGVTPGRTAAETCI